MKTVSAGQVLTPTEVAELFHVDPKTVARWAKAGKIACFRTPGGHRRYRREDIERLVNRAGDGGDWRVSDTLRPGGETPATPGRYAYHRRVTYPLYVV